MSQPIEGQPLGQPQKMRLSELLSRLRAGQGIPSSGMIFIDSTPALGGELSIDPNGNPVYSFGQKFEDGFEGWQPGQRVRSRFLVGIRKTEQGRTAELLVSDSVVGDIRHADTFVLEGLTPQDVQTLENLGVAELDASVEVIDQIRKDFQVSNMQNYRARLDRINGVQKLYDGDPAHLERGPVLVQGIVQGYVVNREYPHEGASVTVGLENGRTVDIELRNGYLNFASGSLEILNPSFPVTGDVVQIQSTYGGKPNVGYGESAPTTLYANFCRSTHLLKPSEERAEANQAQRDRVAQAIDELSQQDDPQTIRDNVSRLIRSNLYTRSIFDGLALTGSEKQKVREIIAAKFTDKADMPLDMFDNTDVSEGEELRRVYGVDVYAMSHRQFFEFAMRVSQGVINPIVEGSVDYHYRVMDRLPAEQREQILQTAVASLYPKVVGKEIVFREKVLIDPEELPDLKTKPYGHRQGNKVVLPGEYDPVKLADPNSMRWDDHYLFEQTLSYLSEHTTEGTARVFLGLAQKMLDEGRFKKEDSERGRDFYEYKIFDSMERNIKGNLTYNWQDYLVKGVNDINVARTYIDHLPMLRVLSQKLADEGWTKGGVSEVIDVLEKAEQYLRHTGNSK